MGRGRKGILTHNVENYILYGNEHYCDVKHPKYYEANELDKLINLLGITYKSLLEYISKKRQLANGMELYKQEIEGDLIRLV